MSHSLRDTMPDNYWIIPREGSIEICELTGSAIVNLFERRFDYFIIGRGKWPAIQGFAENAADVGQLRRLLYAERTRRG
jgi:hypothetical protein